MEIGFSTLSMLNKNLNEVIEIASDNDFSMIEILAEGPYASYRIKKDNRLIKNLKNNNIEINIHGPDVDLNLASINDGIRKESVKQIKDAIDIANEIKANTITIHPGKIGRKDKWLRDYALELSIDSIGKCVDYSKQIGKVKISVENMPKRFNYLGNKIEEIEKIQESTGSKITIDTGHANTCKDCEEFFKLKNIEYFHINDNNGIKDQHLILGEGNLDLKLLNIIDKGIIELNTFEKIMKTKKVLTKLNYI